MSSEGGRSNAQRAATARAQRRHRVRVGIVWQIVINAWNVAEGAAGHRIKAEAFLADANAELAAVRFAPISLTTLRRIQTFRRRHPDRRADELAWEEARTRAGRDKVRPLTTS
ncbi:MAG TPA: hypothetical protein VN668_16225 [Stellaceae bacterium]|nr:hypothetical protein [Stellaceae bacterium]